MYNYSTGYNAYDYEAELRKLVRPDDAPGHPVTPYGRERERIRRLIQSPEKSPSEFIFSRAERPFLLRYDPMQAGFILYDCNRRRFTPLFYDPALSDRLLRYMVDEIYYRALELIAVHLLDEAREALDYRGDTDGRVYEMYRRVREKNMAKWLSAMPHVWNNKDRPAIADEISLLIAHYALFLFFGAMQKARRPGILGRLLHPLNKRRPSKKEVERIFPEQGYSVLGIGNASLFAKAYERFLQQTARTSSDPKHAYRPDLWIINPQPHTIEREHIDFYGLTADTERLRTCLEHCLKRNGSEYAETALRQWRISQSAHTSRRPNPAQDSGRKEAEQAEEQARKLQVLTDTLKEKDEQIARLKEELKAKERLALTEKGAPEADAGILEQFISILRRHENDLFDKNLQHEWVQIEKILMYVFGEIPIIKEIILQIRDERSRIVQDRKKREEKRREPDFPAVLIKENNGPILTAATGLSLPASNHHNNPLKHKDA